MIYIIDLYSHIMDTQNCTRTVKYLELRFNVIIIFLVNSACMVMIVHTSKSRHVFQFIESTNYSLILHFYIEMLLHLPDMLRKLKYMYYCGCNQFINVLVTDKQQGDYRELVIVSYYW